jgi:hypothetical protein
MISRIAIDPLTHLFPESEFYGFQGLLFISNFFWDPPMLVMDFCQGNLIWVDELKPDRLPK